MSDQDARSTVQSDGDPATRVEPARVGQDAAGAGRTVRCAVLERGAGGADLSGMAARPRLEDEGEIARGGMSSIRRAFDPRILRHVAMKVIEPASAAQPGAALRFLEEAQITGQLDHPNIVPVHDLGLRDDGTPEYFTMKLVGGATLSEILRDDSVLGPGSRAAPPTSEAGSRPEAQLRAARLERLLRIFLKVCDAVAFAHARGVIHRDLKPDNVMVGDHGQVYLMDWGVAMLRQGSRPSESSRNPSVPPALNRDPDQRVLDRPGSVIGTPSYMSPEQAWGKLDEIDERSDVFGLGGILYKVLTGHAPNRVPGRGDAMEQARAAQIPPPGEVAPDPCLPPGLCRIAMQALSPKREQRQQSVDALQSEVEAFLHGGGWFSTRSFLAGEVIIAEGDAGNVAYIIQSGRCEVVRTVQGERTIVRHLGPGEVFGETAILTDRPRSATVVALEPVAALVVTRESLEQELDRNTWLSVIVRALAERFRELDARAFT
jgi:serine/threonine-protein kinase